MSNELEENDLPRIEKLFKYDLSKMLDADIAKGLSQEIPLETQVRFWVAEWPSGNLLTIFIDHRAPLSDSQTNVTLRVSEAIKLIKSPLREVLTIGNQSYFAKHVYGLEVGEHSIDPTNHKVEIIFTKDSSLVTLNLVIGHVNENVYAHRTSATMNEAHIKEVLAWLEEYNK